MFVPGTAAIIAIAALVPGGALQLWPLLAAALAGAIVGDGLPFWLGHRQRAVLLERWPLVRYPSLVTRSSAFVERHGDKSVFLARFTPGVRAFVPLFAGILRMPARRFYAANVASALIWAPTHILPGVLLGASFGHLGPAALPAAALLLVLVVLVWGTVRTVRLAVGRGAPFARSLSKRMTVRLRGSESRAGRLVASVLDASRAESRSVLLLGGLLLGSAWTFLATLEDVVTGDPLVALDTSVYHALQGLRTAPGDAVMIAITELGDASVVAGVALAVLGWLAWRRAWRTAAYWTVAVLGASLLGTVVKATLHRARPGADGGEALYAGVAGYSFPSGHSTVNVVLYGVLALMAWRGLAAWMRSAVLIGAVGIALPIAFSRLYLGVHWLSDVVGGAAFGLAWASLLGVYWVRGHIEDLAPRGMLAVAALTLALVGGAHVARSHADDVARYAVKATVPTLAFDTWRTGGWKTLPARRTDVTGETEEPLSLQWAGTVDELRALLEPVGWVLAPGWTPSSAARWLSARSAPEQLPVLPALERGRLPALVMTRPSDTAAGAGGRSAPGATSRRILTLWPADIDVIGASATRPLMLGSVVEQRLRRPRALFTLGWTPGTGGVPLGGVTDALAGTIVGPVPGDGSVAPADTGRGRDALLAASAAVRAP